MRVLVVDDHEENRRFISMLLTGRGHSTVTAVDGEDGLQQLQSGTFDLIVSDILMPIMDGFRFIEHVRADKKFREITFAFFTGTYLDKKDEELAFSLGADAFLHKPIDPEELARSLEEIAISKKSVRRSRKAGWDKEEPLRLYNESMVHKLQKKMADLEREILHRKQVEEARKKAEDDLRQALDVASETLEGAINALALMSELRDPYTAGHQRMVSVLATAIGKELGLPDDQLQGLRVAALVHDVGKVYVPSEILSKPGKLSELEMGLARAHAEASYEIVKPIVFPWPVGEMILQHHERMDGSGYPKGLSGDQISIEARILAVADTVEAMTSHRPYRPALGLEKALDEILSGRGTKYDVQVVDNCVQLFREKGFRLQP